MRCEKCRREMVLGWHISCDKWRMLPRKWWDSALCLECFIVLVSAAQNRLLVLLPEDFGQITIASRRVRGAIRGTWNFPVTKSQRRGR